MHIHILGICGTFMGGVAQLARARGHRVTGCDAGVYPPMSAQLEAAGIDLVEGYGVEQLALNPDCYVIGNAISRGNPLLEEILDRGLAYVSGPQWLADNVLDGRWVLAVAGTHGQLIRTAGALRRQRCRPAAISTSHHVNGTAIEIHMHRRIGIRRAPDAQGLVTLQYGAIREQSRQLHTRLRHTREKQQYQREQTRPGRLQLHFGSP